MSDPCVGAWLLFCFAHLIERRSFMKYAISIEWSQDDHCYLATVPELPGCMADGKTREEAEENVKVIIEEWLETDEMRRRK